MKYSVYFLLLATPLFATIVNVPDDYLTIQVAVDASVNGDTVLVQPGIYVENINLTGKTISLISSGGIANTVIESPIQGEGSIIYWSPGTGLHPDYQLSIVGFTLSNAANGISFNGSYGYIKISNCHFNMCEKGVFGHHHNGWEVSSSVFTNNTIGFIQDYYGYQSEIQNCTFDGNEIDVRWTPLYADTDLIIVNSICTGSLLLADGTTFVSYSNLENVLTENAYLVFEEGVIHQPSYFDLESDTQLELQEISPCIDSGSPDTNGDGIPWYSDADDQDPDGSRPDMGALYYHQNIRKVSGSVDGDWIADTLYQVIGDLEVSETDSLIISPGTVVEFLGYYGVTVYGSIYANGSEQDSITFRSGLESQTNLDWGGFHFPTSVSPSHLSYCDISHGASGDDDYQALIYFNYTYDRGITIQNCTIHNSGAHGLYINEHSHPEILNNEIKNNNRCGIKLRQQSSPNIIGNSIHDNSECGIKTKWNCNALISSNLISNNPWGLYNRDQCTTTIQYNLFDGNGSAIILEDSSPTIVNNTIVNSSANGVAVWNGSFPEIENNIFYSNQNGISADGTPVSISYNGFYSNSNNDHLGPGLPTDTGTLNYENNNGDPCDIYYNIYLDPLFANEDNFYLSSISPLIDAGNPDSELNEDDSVSDIGAFYYHQTIGCMDPMAINFNPDATIEDESCIYLEDVEPHFLPIWSGMPTNPMGFYIASATIDEIDLRVGDEIAIFDGEVCVGHAQLESEIIPDLQIFSSQDNPATEDQDGFINGNEIFYRFWDASEQIELINVVANVTGGSEVFQSLGFSSAGLSVELIFGCTDSDAINYNPSATVDDGSCIIPIYGCTDETACNYNPEANTDDDSCLYYDCAGECGGTAYIDNCGICDDDPNNDNECIGCTDPWALNYDPIYTIDDGSCEYPGFGDLVPDGSLNVLDVVALVEHVLEEFEYVSFADLNNDGYINIIDIVILVDIILNPGYLGCTDPTAFNYSPDAIYNDGCVYYGSVTDIDGNVYPTRMFGEQVWITENLKTTHYNNSEEIPTGFTNAEWSNLSTGAFSIYNNEPSNTNIYGNLYNWYAVDDERGVCPEGFHVPSDEEWMDLELFLGMDESELYNIGFRGTDQGSQLAGNADMWDNGGLENNPAFGTSGFLALPGGHRHYNNGNFNYMGNHGNFWSSSEYNSADAWSRELHSTRSEVYRYGYTYNWRNGFSVRCIQDDEDTYGCTDQEADNYSPEAVIDDGSCEYSCIDIDGNSYETVVIGDQLWMAENLKVSHYRTGDEIPSGYSASQWPNLSTGAYAIYNNDPEIAESYGFLYNWHAVNDERGICPEDWHVPTDEEWLELEVFLGMSWEEAISWNNWRGTIEGGKLKEEGLQHWAPPNTAANNESGFTGLPGGSRFCLFGSYSNLGYNGSFWSSTINNGGGAWSRRLAYDKTEIWRSAQDDRREGLSVRCIKD